MRTVVLGALAFTSGCNWVFGLGPVTLTDAQEFDTPPDAPLPTVKLSAITPMLSAAGAPTRQARYVPLTPAPTVQYGARGEALVDTTITGEEVPVGYAFADSPDIWRLVYTLPGGVPHEVHWKPSTINPGHAVALQLTPNDRDPAPASGTFHLLANGSPPATWFLPRMYTTNTWTLDPSPSPNGMQINSDFASVFTKPIAGEKRKPDPLKDFEVVLEYDDSADGNECTVATGSAAFHIDLANGATPGTPMWSNSFRTGMTVSGGDLGTIGNLINANGLVDGADIMRYQVVTYGPGGGIPLHHQLEPGVPLPIPVGILLAKCQRIAGTTVPSFNSPTDAALPTIGTVMLVTKPLAVANGPMVRNGIEQSIVGDNGPFAINYDGCSFATMPTIDTIPVNITALDTVAIPAGGPTASLGFEASIPDPIIEMYEATLYKIDGGALVPIREFTFTELPLQFNRNQGQPAGTRYVFAIRVIRGASANAVNADFTFWANTQTVGVTHTQSFTLD